MYTVYSEEIGVIGRHESYEEAVEAAVANNMAIECWGNAQFYIVPDAIPDVTEYLLPL